MADIINDEPATYAADPELIDKANGYLVDADDWNQVLSSLRQVNDYLHGGTVPSNLRNAAGRIGGSAVASPFLELSKSEAGQAELRYLSAGVQRWRWVFGATKTLSLERYSSGGVLQDTPLLLSNTASTATSDLQAWTWNFASAQMIFGAVGTSGNAQVLFRKGDANNQTTLAWRSGATGTTSNENQWGVQHDNAENLNFLRFDGTSNTVLDTPLRLRKTDGAIVVLVQNPTLELGTTTTGAAVIAPIAVSSGVGTSMAVRAGQGQGASAGGAFTARAGQGGATGAGGATTIEGGPGGATSGAGGALTCSGGTPVDGNGAAATFRASSGVGTNRTGGTLTCSAGDGTGTGTPGAANLTAGSGGSGSVNGGAFTCDGGNSGGGGGTGGTFQARGGAGTTTGGIASLIGGGVLGSPAFATGGAATVRGGHGTGATNGPGGAANLLGGDGSGNQAGGDVNITGGAAGPSGTGSSVIITARASNAGGVSQGGDVRLIPGRGGASQSEGTVEITGSITMQTTISPGTLAAGTTQNYAPTDVGYASYFRITPDAGGTSALGGLTGIQAGRRIIIANIGSSNLTINHEDAGSTAENRFRCPGVANLVIPREGLREFIYDGPSQRWRPMGAVA